MKRLAMAVLLILSACSSRVIQVPVVVESMPQGGRVDVDGIDYGSTPANVYYQVTQLWNGLLNSPNWVSVKNISNITCYPPPGTSAVPQTKTITPANLSDGRGKVFFDFRIEPALPSQRLDVKVKQVK